MFEVEQGLGRIVPGGELRRASRELARAFVGIWLVLSSVACGPRPRPGVAPRHLLLISVENLRADHVSSLGYDRRTTALLRPDRPVVLDLDRIARTGVSFANAFAPSSSASFSLASFFGGQISPEGTLGEAPSLAESFQSAGFRSACFVTRNSLDSAGAAIGGLARGFEKAGLFDTDEETLAAAVAWLKAQVPKGGQHFTWLHLAGIQPPFAGQPFADRYSAGAEAFAGRSTEQFVASLRVAELPPGPEARRHLIDLYDGRLLREVELLNSFFFLYENEIGAGPAGNGDLWETSLIAVLGSSGCELAEHPQQIGGERSLRDEGLHVPLLLSHAQSLTGERIFAEPVELPDLNATLRDWFHLEADTVGEGRSLLALTDSYVRRPFAGRPALAIAPGVGFSLRSERYRLTVRDGARQLFDMQLDPAAKTDVASQRPAIVEQLLESAKQRLERLGFSF